MILIPSMNDLQNMLAKECDGNLVADALRRREEAELVEEMRKAEQAGNALLEAALRSREVGLDVGL